MTWYLLGAASILAVLYRYRYKIATTAFDVAAEVAVRLKPIPVDVAEHVSVTNEDPVEEVHLFLECGAKHSLSTASQCLEGVQKLNRSGDLRDLLAEIDCPFVKQHRDAVTKMILNTEAMEEHVFKMEE